MVHGGSGDSQDDRTLARLGAVPGYVFLADRADQLCFVPAELVSFNASGGAVIDHVGYVVSGWSQRNARWAVHAGSSAHVFPDDDRLVVDGAAPGFQHQLARWREFIA